MTFTHILSSGFQRESEVANPNVDSQVTVGTGGGIAEIDRPATIVHKMASSQWSSDGLDPSQFEATLDAERNRTDAKWNYFYRLVFELVTCGSPENAAQVALDRLLDELQLTSGGVVIFGNGESSDRGIPPMAVLAARQAVGSSYHRVSDFLVKSVIRDRQAVLARNVQDDSQLSLARESGRRETVSIIVAPLRRVLEGKEQVIGLLHVYSAGEERMLTANDLDFAVGVADNLAIAILRQQENAQLAKDLDKTRRKLDLLEKELAQSNEMVGTSKAIAKVQQAISKAGPTTATVLIRGESGVGKELVARAIHQASHRANGPLLCLNCAALAPTLLESELFGHEKGAFTGATERKIGKFEAADGGTLLLDEVGEMVPELQAKFLRVLEGQAFERLGGNKPITTDVRVIAATNRNLEEAVKAKEFRSDLYYRLRVIEIDVPPLRLRKDDVPLLVEHFLEMLKHHAGRRISGIEPEALELLCRHQWPGNVRELKNVMERAIVLGGNSTIAIEDLGLSALTTTPASIEAETTPSFAPIPIAELEEKHIFAMLEYADGNKTKAAQLLGIERSTLDRKLKRYSKR